MSEHGGGPGALDTPEARELLADREAISRLLAAPESRQLLELLRRQGGDLQQAAQAALKGDGRELSALMDRVTATGEGARAAEKLRERMERR